MKFRGLHLVLVAIISALLGYYIGVSKVAFEWNNFHPSLSIVNKEPSQTFSNVDFSEFWTVLDKLQKNYYDKKAIDTKKMVNGAISGMVQSLGDPYTVYLPPVQNTDFKQGLAGQQFEGIGAELGMEGKQIIVVAPLEGNPAKAAGVLPGDAILKVNDQLTSGWTLAQAVEKIRGPHGTTVRLSILHKNSEKPQDISIKRGTIKVKSVTGWVKKISTIDGVKDQSLKNSFGDKTVAYVRISQFGDPTNQEWLSVINAITQQIKNTNASGIIVDVRNNPGGYLTDATYIASEFIPDGTVVIQEQGNGERTEFPVVRKGILTDIPVVVLINKGSASASEILAGALRDRREAKLVGDTSFGKGTIQEAEDLGGGAGLHVTIAKWLTPNGTWVHGKGLTPDVSVSADEKNPVHDSQLEKAISELVQ